MNPQQYVTSKLRELYPTYGDAAHDIGINEVSVGRYFCGKASPASTVIRTVQLIEFIKSQGLEIPPPLDFE